MVGEDKLRMPVETAKMTVKGWQKICTINLVLSTVWTKNFDPSWQKSANESGLFCHMKIW